MWLSAIVSIFFQFLFEIIELTNYLISANKQRHHSYHLNDIKADRREKVNQMDLTGSRCATTTQISNLCLSSGAYLVYVNNNEAKSMTANIKNRAQFQLRELWWWFVLWTARAKRVAPYAHSKWDMTDSVWVECVCGWVISFVYLRKTQEFAFVKSVCLSMGLMRWYMHIAHGTRNGALDARHRNYVATSGSSLFVSIVIDLITNRQNVR